MENMAMRERKERLFAVLEKSQDADLAPQILQLAIESVAASIIITNIQGEIEYVNPRFTEVTGYILQECIGKNPRFLKDPEKKSVDYKELWDVITQGRTWQGTVRNIKKNGAFFWESATISPVFNKAGEIIRFVAVKEDITERCKTEQALRESENKYRELARKIPIPLCIVNNEENVTFLNDRFTDTFGYSMEDMPALADWWRLAYPDVGYRKWVIKTWSSAVMSAVLKQTDIEMLEYNVTCKNGSVLIAAISGSIINDGLLATFLDVTKRRRQEKLLKAAFERKKKNGLMNELITASLPSRQTLNASVRMLGMRVAEPFNCYLIIVDKFKGKPCEYWSEFQEEYQQMIDALVDELADSSCVTWESAEGVGIIYFDEIAEPEPVDRQEQQIGQAEKIRQLILRQRPDIDFYIGIAERAATLTDIGAYYQQASIAAQSGRKMWPARKIHHYLDIGIFQVLPFINDKKQIAAYIDRVLGNILRYDKKKKTEFLETLEIILVSDNLKEAAETLSIHYKTLMFRKQRLEEILGISFDNFASRMAVATAVNLMKLHAGKEEG